MTSTDIPASLAERLAVVHAAVGALQGISGVMCQAPSGELGGIVGTFGQLAALGTAAMVVATSDAEQRGVVEQSQCASTAAWVADNDWHLKTGGASAIAKSATILRRPDLKLLADAVRTTDVIPHVAVTVADQFDKLAPDLADGAEPAVLDAMIEMGAEHGGTAVRHLREHLLARYGRDGAFQDEQDAKRRYVDLSCGRDEAGIFHYELTLDAEGRAVLEAAIGPLSKPMPDPDGEQDTRPVGRRRGQALVEVCRRATAAGGQVPTATKACVYVTIGLAELQARAGAATTIGSLDGGALLGPETARKLACDAQIMPVVLGSDSEILEMGRSQRLFTPGQLKALWLRDRHCTYPGCQAPAHWADAHHVRHWIDGGPTDLNNAALLCGRHHTIVHRDQLAGTIIDGQVLWDRKPGSYQRQPTTRVA